MPDTGDRAGFIGAFGLGCQRVPCVTGRTIDLQHNSPGDDLPVSCSTPGSTTASAGRLTAAQSVVTSSGATPAAAIARRKRVAASVAAPLVHVNVDDVPRLVAGAVDVDRRTSHGGVGLVDALGAANARAALARCVLVERGKLTHPVANRRGIHDHAARGKALRGVDVAQAVAHVPAHREHDDVWGKRKPANSVVLRAMTRRPQPKHRWIWRPWRSRPFSRSAAMSQPRQPAASLPTLSRLPRHGRRRGRRPNHRTPRQNRRGSRRSGALDQPRHGVLAPAALGRKSPRYAPW